MAKSTGIIIAVGAISFANEVFFTNSTPSKIPAEAFKIPVATAIAALLLDGLEHVSQPLAVGIAWIALITVTLTRVGGKPSPAENLLNYTGTGNQMIKG